VCFISILKFMYKLGCLKLVLKPTKGCYCFGQIKENVNPKFESAFYTNLHEGACDGTTPTMEF